MAVASSNPRVPAPATRASRRKRAGPHFPRVFPPWNARRRPPAPPRAPNLTRRVPLPNVVSPGLEGKGLATSPPSSSLEHMSSASEAAGITMAAPMTPKTEREDDVKESSARRRSGRVRAIHARQAELKAKEISFRCLPAPHAEVTVKSLGACKEDATVENGGRRPDGALVPLGYRAEGLLFNEPLGLGRPSRRAFRPVGSRGRRPAPSRHVTRRRRERAGRGAMHRARARATRRPRRRPGPPAPPAAGCADGARRRRGAGAPTPRRAAAARAPTAGAPATPRRSCDAGPTASARCATRAGSGSRAAAR